MSRSVFQDFMVVTKPWVEKVQTTKDLKPIRSANFFFQLEHLRDIIRRQLAGELADHDVMTREELLAEARAIRDILEFNPVGGKKVREDLWRRLLWVEISWPLSAN